jgi:hypothetical protein
VVLLVSAIMARSTAQESPSFMDREEGHDKGVQRLHDARNVVWLILFRYVSSFEFVGVAGDTPTTDAHGSNVSTLFFLSCHAELPFMD